MATRFFLLRHAAHDNVGGFLAGRTPGIRLGEAGRAQALRLGERMRRESFGTVVASPRERTQETAAAVAEACGTGAVRTDQRLDEIDFGDWSGRSFDDLNGQSEWQRWNTVRSLARTPAGDTMFDVQARVVGLMRELDDGSAGAPVVLVSHADVIKAALAYYLGLSLDAWPRFDIEPASISIIDLEAWSARVIRVNEPVG